MSEERIQESQQEVVAVAVRQAYAARYKAVGGLHPRQFGDPWCEAGNCWKRVKTVENRATPGLVRFGPKEMDGGMWRLCALHRRIIED